MGRAVELGVVSPALAKKLRKLKYHRVCKKYYSPDEYNPNKFRLRGSVFPVTNRRKVISAPYLESVNMWMRDIYKLYINIEPYNNKGELCWIFSLLKLDHVHSVSGGYADFVNLSPGSGIFDTYDDALEYGLLEACSYLKDKLKIT